MSNIFKTYRKLRESGHTEEEALSEAEDFFRPSNVEIDDLVTKKDLEICTLKLEHKMEIAFLEQEAKLEPRFNKIETSLNVLKWAIAAILGLVGTQFWYLMNRMDALIGILNK